MPNSDATGDFEMAVPLARFLDKLDSTDELPRTILYSLNGRDNDVLARELAEVAEAFRDDRRRVTPEKHERRLALIGTLRHLLASVCVEALEPGGFVEVDGQLLDTDDEGEIAHVTRDGVVHIGGELGEQSGAFAERRVAQGLRQHQGEATRRRVVIDERDGERLAVGEHVEPATQCSLGELGALLGVDRAVDLDHPPARAA